MVLSQFWEEKVSMSVEQHSFSYTDGGISP